MLDSLEFIDGVSLDLGKIDKDTDINADIPLPKGVTKVSPEKITLHVKVDSEDKRILTMSESRRSDWEAHSRLSFSILNRRR